jgi:hypothetical protein
MLFKEAAKDNRMQYFTKALWLAFQEDHVDASEAWDQSVAMYRAQLEGLRTKLSKNAQRFFDSISLHDGLLLSFSIGDDVEEKTDPKTWKRQTSAFLKVRLSSNNSPIYTLKYTGVRRCVVDFPSDSPIFHGGENGFDDWGYAELSDAADGHLQHEILFASGATILIEFRRFSYKRIAPRKKE